MIGDTVPKLAVLIDADNARFSTINLVLSPYLTGWKDKLLEQAIQPIQQFAYTHGKNATDSAMIIDAMDLLYSNRYDGFCLVSSDSDFTRLAARIREAGFTVYGLGEQKTPKPFVVACDKFIYTENLIHIDKLVPHADSITVNENPSPARRAQEDEHLLNQLRMTVEAASNDDGWARLTHVANLLTKNFPDFDSRSYGYHKLSDLIIATSRFEVSRRSPHKGAKEETYVRDKHRKVNSSAK
ncbi:hypothetical protein N7523_001716 [Penicillium sp. IBT 18751x]|nr:hypothetical protein N7523_001716 [Penicillium sp. IBT 18751x]